jgi:hypothetical protein
VGENPKFDSWRLNGKEMRGVFVELFKSLRDDFDPDADPKKRPFIPYMLQRCPGFADRVHTAYAAPLAALGEVIDEWNRSGRSLFGVDDGDDPLDGTLRSDL